MSSEIYKSLNYDHQNINFLLDKINKHFVLTEKEYKQLQDAVKFLNHFPDFDGSYDSLTGLPNIHEIAHVIAMDRDTALRSELLTRIEDGDAELLEDLLIRIDDFYSKLEELQDGMITVDEEIRAELKDEINATFDYVGELENKILEVEEAKANKEHIHSSEDIEDIDKRLFELKSELETQYLLQECHDKRHTHDQGLTVLNTITKEKIEEWNNKLNQDQLDALQKQLTEIELDYISRDEVIQEVIGKIPDLSNFVLTKDLYALLDKRAYATHTHTFKDIPTLIDKLNSKVDKEKNKTLINGTTLAKLELLLKKHEMGLGGLDQHSHKDLFALDLISFEFATLITNRITKDNIDKWDAGVSAETVKEIIIDLLEENDLTGLDKRLNGLSFIPITQAEFDELPEDKKTDKSLIYIITDAGADEVETLENFVTKEQVNIIIDNLLDERLDHLRLKQVDSAEYNSMESQEENVLYVITDAMDIDMSVYLTKNNLEERVSEPATTANRPTAPVAGQCYFDVTLGKPIWFSGEVWVDALGNEV